MQAIERYEVHVALTSDAVGAEPARLAGDRFEPFRHGSFGCDEYGHVLWLDATASAASPPDLRTQVAGQHERTPENRHAARIVWQWLKAQCLG